MAGHFTEFQHECSRLESRQVVLSQLSLGAIDGTAAGRGDQEIRNSSKIAFKVLFIDGQKNDGTNVCQ